MGFDLGGGPVYRGLPIAGESGRAAWTRDGTCLLEGSTTLTSGGGAPRSSTSEESEGGPEMKLSACLPECWRRELPPEYLLFPLPLVLCVVSVRRQLPPPPPLWPEPPRLFLPEPPPRRSRSSPPPRRSLSWPPLPPSRERLWALSARSCGS